MKQRFIYTLIIIAVVLGEKSFAQAPQFSIFDSFERAPKPGEGKVKIHQSNDLKMLVGTRIDSDNIDVINNRTYLITRGYRINVYSGNNQRKSKDEAFSIQSKIRELYPDMTTDVTYYAPFWKLLVGNFRSFEEASLMQRVLREKFPKIKNEIYIIEDDIRLLLD
ncbi:MAG: SPOR domain-containing protein [Tannerella sp.]|jgi:hypothetical protein|nr:SPOR domain-containing protein [Tannerella sp.]